MPTFDCIIAHDVSCYASVEVEAATPEEAVSKIKADVETYEEFFDQCQPEWGTTSHNERIVEIVSEDGITTHQGLSLAEDPEIVYLRQSIAKQVEQLQALHDATRAGVMCHEAVALSIGDILADLKVYT